MNFSINFNGKFAICLIFLANFALVACYQQQFHSETHDSNAWPVTLTFAETKTNALLGEALLKRVYARIGFTDNIIRAEVDTLFENLKDVIEKKMRNCERKRRRAGSIQRYDTTSYGSSYGASSNNPYNTSTLEENEVEEKLLEQEGKHEYELVYKLWDAATLGVSRGHVDRDVTVTVTIIPWALAIVNFYFYILCLT